MYYVEQLNKKTGLIVKYTMHQDLNETYRIMEQFLAIDARYPYNDVKYEYTIQEAQ